MVYEFREYGVRNISNLLIDGYSRINRILPLCPLVESLMND